MSHVFIGYVAVGAQIGLGHLARTAAVLRALQARGADVHLLVERRAPEGEWLAFAPLNGTVPVRSCMPEETPTILTDLAAKTGRMCGLLTDLPEGEQFDFHSTQKMGFNPLVCLNAYHTDMTGADLAFLRGVSWDAARVFPRQIRAGAGYEFVADKARSLRPQKPWSSSGSRRVLVTLGSSDPGRLTEQVAALALQYFDEVTLVVGPLFSPERRSDFVSLEGDGALVRWSPTDLQELMLSADVVITLGGQTAYEGMCLGRPVAGIRWGSMTNAVAFLARNGVLIDLGGVAEAGLRLAGIRHSPEELRSVAKAGWSRIDGRGAERMAAEVAKISE